MGILQSPDPEWAIKTMKKRGLLKYVFPYADVTAAARGVNETPADQPLFRLAFLLYNTPDDAVQKTTSDLKMSGADAGFVRTLLAFRSEVLENTPLFARKMIAKYGDVTLPALSLRAAKGEDTSALSDIVSEQMRAGVCVKIADLAVNGAALTAVGIPKGREMGRVLNALLARVMEDPALNQKDMLLSLAADIYKEN